MDKLGALQCFERTSQGLSIIDLAPKKLSLSDWF